MFQRAFHLQIAHGLFSNRSRVANMRSHICITRSYSTRSPFMTGIRRASSVSTSDNIPRDCHWIVTFSTMPCKRCRRPSAGEACGCSETVCKDHVCIPPTLGKLLKQTNHFGKRGKPNTTRQRQISTRIFAASLISAGWLHPSCLGAFCQTSRTVSLPLRTSLQLIKQASVIEDIHPKLSKNWSTCFFFSLKDWRPSFLKAQDTFWRFWLDLRMYEPWLS